MKQATDRKSGWEISISCRAGLNLLAAFLLVDLNSAGSKKKKYMENKNINEVFIGITYSDKGIVPVDVYVVNPTEESFSFTRMQGSFDGTGDTLLDLGYSKRPSVELKSQSYHQIDHMRDVGELDFTTYYNVDILAKDGTKRHIFQQINGWSFAGRPTEWVERLPVLNQSGLMLKDS